MSRTRWMMAAVLGVAALYPLGARQLARHRALERVEVLREVSVGAVDCDLSPRVRPLGPVLASWETIGGCGAGGSTSSGSVKWIGRNTTGGLFQSVTLSSFQQVPQTTLVHSGYNASLTQQVSTGVGDKWGVGVLAPFLYKYYADYYGLGYDISNGGLGDISALVTRKLGRINDTLLTLTVGFPTGKHDARYKMDLLTQEKQLGLGTMTGGVSLDHSMEQSWGLFVVGTSASWRGGLNELGSYRAPTGSLYGHAGYYLGPLMPAVGLTLNGFTASDRDRGTTQGTPLATLAPSGSIEWSTDWIALLLGMTLPYRLDKAQPWNHAQPWTVALGVSVSPF